MAFVKVSGGKAIWKAQAGAWYDDGPDGGTPIAGALGSKVAVNYAAVEIGGIDYTPGANQQYWTDTNSPTAAEDLAKYLPISVETASYRWKVNGAVLGRRIMMVNGKHATQAADDLHTLYVNAPESGQGKVPIVLLGRRDATNPRYPDKRIWAPTFEIVEWIRNPWTAKPAVAVDDGTADETEDASGKVTCMTVGEAVQRYGDNPETIDESERAGTRAETMYMIDKLRARTGIRV